ncbi:MAG: secondary thiamine-phosphate synthase [Gammaproteobacteria bacterium]|nr:MAG: secondary thiamine-phosphate synthase [Gammaproteobacteria bacterium]
MIRETITKRLDGRGTYEITNDIQAAVARSGVQEGLCHIFIHHTSASLIICENADPVVRTDLEAFISRWVPDGHKMFQHVDEGNDDMPAHIRTVMTHSSLQIPVAAGRLDLGTWQGVFIYEHRADTYARRLTVTVQD